MKIVILGSHGTGKTTLTKRLHGYLQNNYELRIESVKAVTENNEFKLRKPVGELRWTYLPEAPFEATQRGFTMNQDTSLESEIWIIAKQLELERISPPWIADKCLIDILAYARYLFRQEVELLNLAERVVKRNVDYDLVLYLPAGEFPIEDDGLRCTDVDFQKNIDQEIVRLMEELQVEYRILRGGKEERFNKAKRLVEGIF
jgi:nicotinamide riboside kinase